MDINKAVKKLEKNGFVVIPGHIYHATLEGSNYHIEFFKNGSSNNISSPKVQRNGVIDHPEFDDFNGTYCDNITQAIRYCKKWNF